jgi:hypothetical protein
MRFIRFVVSTMAIAAVMCSLPARAHAQAADVPSAQTTASPSFADARQQISASPFLVMWKYFNVEYERRATTATT